MLLPRAPELSHHRCDKLSNYLYTCCDAQFTFPTEPTLWHNIRFLTGDGTGSARSSVRALYSPAERQRRDATPWTLVQGILAPIQFLAFLISLGLVLRYLATGEGLWVATASIVVKTLLLYAIMITGSIWERVVFGRYLFASAFFWEDVFSILVLTLHTGYLVAIIGDIGSSFQQMMLVLAAYASYAINASQFLLKLRAARRQERELCSGAPLAAESAK